ncbi:MAG: peroxiredoxin, partial [Pyrinomonadaceae bacterium]|nr:peroxiredoxin [Pyrinomonadaceae bacterium]
KQLCSVRDNWDDYLETGATVIGISTDSAESHKDFKEKHGFPFTLLADENGRVVSAYGAKSWIPGKSARAVVVIDKQGNIASHKVQSLGVFAPGDDEVIAAIRESQSAEN